jgi:hypothetical protein
MNLVNLYLNFVPPCSVLVDLIQQDPNFVPHGQILVGLANFNPPSSTLVDFVTLCINNAPPGSILVDLVNLYPNLVPPKHILVDFVKLGPDSPKLTAVLTAAAAKINRAFPTRTNHGPLKQRTVHLSDNTIIYESKVSVQNVFPDLSALLCQDHTQNFRSIAHSSKKIETPKVYFIH